MPETIQSGRVQGIQPSPSVLAHNRVSSLIAKGRDVISLTIGEPDFATPEHVIEPTFAPAEQDRTHYTPGSGIEELRAAIADVLRSNEYVWVLTDEIYEHFAFDRREVASIASLDDQVAQRALTVNSVSKAYAMAGWRIGYATDPRAADFSYQQDHRPEYDVPQFCEPSGCRGGARWPARFCEVDGEQV